MDGTKAIWVPVEELVPGHMYYITSSKTVSTVAVPIISSPTHLPLPDCLLTNRFHELHLQSNHIVGIFRCKTGPTEYMFTHVSLTALSPSFPHFYNSRYHSFYTSIRYTMLSVYRTIRERKDDLSFREDLISYVWEPARVQRFWLCDGFATYENMV
jgi:hypothetical protein